ncbi:MAG: response regulator transcription factor [Acidobacteria bacterium]|nr:response regulator transcription factor [Acidobacteriota bacterium]
MKPIRVLLADDHTLVRAGLRSLLESLPGIEVVAEAGDGREALRLVATLHPHIALMDIAMPELNGLEAAALLAKESPDTRVIILSMHASEEYVVRALRASAAGYLLKDSGIAELELAVKAVARGETYLSPLTSKHVITDYVRRIGGEASLLEQLTPRQREVLQLIAEGHSTKAIAQKLSLSVKTVETHRAQLMERLDIHDLAGLVRYAIRAGLVTPDQ